MKTSKLVGALERLPSNQVIKLDFGGVRYGVAKVSIVTGVDEVVIEAGDLGMTVAGLISELLREDPESDVILFTKNDDDYGYYNIGRILRLSNSIWITAGRYISGGR